MNAPTCECGTCLCCRRRIAQRKHRQAVREGKTKPYSPRRTNLSEMMDEKASDPAWWAKFEYLPRAAERFRGMGPIAGGMRVVSL